MRDAQWQSFSNEYELYHFSLGPVGGPQPTVGSGFLPQQDVLSSSGKGELSETPALEFYFQFSFLFLKPVFSILVCSGSRSVKFIVV